MTIEEPAWRNELEWERRTQIARVIVISDDGEMVWNEGVKRYLALRVPSAELIGLRYQAGALTFPRSLPRELRDELWSRTFPLLAPLSPIG